MRAGQSHRSRCSWTQHNHQPTGTNGKQNTADLIYTHSVVLVWEPGFKTKTKQLSKQKTMNVKELLFKWIIHKMWWSIPKSQCLWCAWRAQQFLLNSLFLILKSVCCAQHGTRKRCHYCKAHLESAGHVNCHGDATCTLGRREPSFDGQSGGLRLISLWLIWTRTFCHNIQRWAKPWASSH